MKRRAKRDESLAPAPLEELAGWAVSRYSIWLTRHIWLPCPLHGPYSHQHRFKISAAEVGIMIVIAGVSSIALQGVVNVLVDLNRKLVMLSGRLLLASFPWAMLFQAMFMSSTYPDHSWLCKPRCYSIHSIYMDLPG